jgi:shikimate kinase
MAINTDFLFVGTQFLTVRIAHPIEKTMMMVEHTNTNPALLSKNDQISDLVAARYRLTNAKRKAASPAHKAKKIIDTPNRKPNALKIEKYQDAFNNTMRQTIQSGRSIFNY